MIRRTYFKPAALQKVMMVDFSVDFLGFYFQNFAVKVDFCEVRKQIEFKSSLKFVFEFETFPLQKC